MSTLQEVLGDGFAFTLRHLSEQEALQLMSELGDLTPDETMKRGTRWIFRYSEGAALLMMPGRKGCPGNLEGRAADLQPLPELTASADAWPPSDEERLFCALVAQVKAAVDWVLKNEAGAPSESVWICADKVR